MIVVLLSAAIEFNGAHLRIPAALIGPGDNTIDMRFASPIAPAGASVIRFARHLPGTTPADACLLLYVYAKSRTSDLTARQIRELRNLVAEELE